MTADDRAPGPPTPPSTDAPEAPVTEDARGQRASGGATAEKRIGQTIAGRYRIESLLGFGGMGAVYVAIQEPLGRRVALKCIRSVLTDDELAVKRFIQEARAVSQLAHPNIVVLHDFGQDDDGTLFIAMELLDGHTVREELERAGPVEARRSVDIVRQVTSALAQAHAHAIIHRDLKPDNIMLVDVKGAGQTAKVVDFGVAKLAQLSGDDLPLTGTGHVVGTPGYIAPEEMNGVLDDARSDLYALGVVWFEMVTGCSPFEGETPMKKAFQHLTEPPPRPNELSSPGVVPHVVEELILRLLEKKPEDRPPSADALLTLLDRVEAELEPKAASSDLNSVHATVDQTLPPELAEAAGDDDDDDDLVLAPSGPPLPLTLIGLLAAGGALGYLSVWFWLGG